MVGSDLLSTLNFLSSVEFTPLEFTPQPSSRGIHPILNVSPVMALRNLKRAVAPLFGRAGCLAPASGEVLLLASCAEQATARHVSALAIASMRHQQLQTLPMWARHMEGTSGCTAARSCMAHHGHSMRCASTDAKADKEEESKPSGPIASDSKAAGAKSTAEDAAEASEEGDETSRIIAAAKAAEDKLNEQVIALALG